MLFSSTLFLFLFLPLVLALHRAAGPRFRNGVLLAASLVFYAWGEAWLVALMLVSILANWALALLLERAAGESARRSIVTLAVAFNLAMLVAFKYADWLWQGLSAFLGVGAGEPLGSLLFTSEWGRAVFLNSQGELRLPLGISFFTFQALSYVVDVYRRDVPAQPSLARFGLYISFFPQLVAGPIVRYRDVAEQIAARSEAVARRASGVRRFAIGLGKKVLVANTVGALAQELFALPHGQVTPAVAWLGTLAYTIQIYFDFSGYSDMAIGLGRLFGFEFVENFEHPYVARSVTEFWRRWHISLSTWFRDYLYIPLGGGRVSAPRVYANLALVFVLCGLWHGASLNFLLFGAYHGALLVLERAFLGARLALLPAFLRHAYLLVAVMFGWVFFRCEDTGLLGTWFTASFGLADGRPDLAYPALYLDPARLLALAAGIAGSLPWIPWVESRLAEAPGRARRFALVADATLVLVLVLCAIELSAGTFNPFIYFRF